MDVTARVNSDASLRVTERISFVTEGREIRRGLIRDIPVVHRESGRRVVAHFQLLSATLDGSPVPFELRTAGERVEIHLGDESLLSHGQHEYILTYVMTKQLIFHDDGDELYWNATGNDWIFPIEKATFRVELPQGAEIMETDAMTGRTGARGTDWQLDSDGVFETTRICPPGRVLPLYSSGLKAS